MIQQCCVCKLARVGGTIIQCGSLVICVAVFFSMAQQPLTGRGFTSTLRTPPRQDSFGRVTSPKHRPLPNNTQHNRQTCPWRYSNLQSQRASGGRPTPQTARPLGQALFGNKLCNHWVVFLAQIIKFWPQEIALDFMMTANRPLQ